MKTNIVIGLILLLVVAGTALSPAQSTIRSNGTGGGAWDSSGTWQGGVVPGVLDSVVLQSPDSVFIGAYKVDSCRSLTVLSGAKMSELDTGSTAIITNVLTLQANATYYYMYSVSSRFPGQTRSIDNASTIVHRGNNDVGDSTMTNYGNLVVTVARGISTRVDVTIHGNLTVNMAGPTNTFRAITRTMPGYRTNTVMGNVYLYQGQWVCVDYGSDSTIGATWNVNGDVIVHGSGSVSGTPARFSPFSSASARGLGVFNIHGNLTFHNGRFSGGTSSTRGYGTGIVNLYKDFTLGDSAYATLNHYGPLSVNFLGTGLQTVTIDSNFSFTLEPISDTIASTSHVIFNMGKYVWRSGADTTLGNHITGNIVVNGILEMKDSSRFVGNSATGSPSFYLNPGATLIAGSKDGIAALPDSSHGNIQVTGVRSYSTSANYEYNGSVAQTTGDGLPANVNNLTINNPNGVTLTNPVTVDGTLTGASGNLFTGANAVTIGASGQLVEPTGNTVLGTVVATRTVNANSTVTFGGIGASMTSSAAAPGSTTVTRGTGAGSVQHGPVSSSVARYFDIVPANNSNLNATFTFAYDSTELNGENASNLQLWKSTDAGVSWIQQGASNSVPLKQLTATGVNSFSRWTVSDLANQMGASGLSYVVTGTWNLISLPLTVVDPRKSTLFPAATSLAFTYSGSYVRKDTILHGMGYWLKFAAADTVGVVGIALLNDTVKVGDGWSMIGSVIQKVARGAIIQNPTSIVKSNYFGYNGASYIIVDTIVPGKGYWVKTAGTGGNGQLILHSGSASVPKQISSPIEAVKGLNSLTMTDRMGNKQTLYFGTVAEGFDASFYEMPPLAPEVSFDLRFGSGRFVETYPSGVRHEDFPVLVTAANGPVTLSWNIHSGNQRVAIFSANGRESELSGTGKMTLAQGSSALTLSIGDRNIPATFSLGKNYPNPFNPSTQFVVGVPVVAHVEIAVFDLLGQRVRTLVDDQLAAGYHTFGWNGLTEANTPATSGVYFIRLVSDKFNAVEKIIMMK